MASYARLTDMGLMPEVCLDHGVTTSLYCADPDDNLVELEVDSFQDYSASTDWIRTAAAFAENPVGHLFTAEVIYRDHFSGTPFDRIRAGISKGDYAASEAPNLSLPTP